MVDVPVVLFNIPVEAQRLCPMVQTFRRTTEIPQLLDTVIDVPVAQIVQVVFVVAQRRFPMVQTVQRNMEIPQLQFIDKVFDVSVVHVQQIPRVQSVRRQS